MANKRWYREVQGIFCWFCQAVLKLIKHAAALLGVSTLFAVRSQFGRLCFL